jgi:hypothetical protein
MVEQIRIKESVELCGNHDGLGTEPFVHTLVAVLMLHSQVKTNFTNPFLVYGRASKHGRKWVWW